MLELWTGWNFGRLVLAHSGGYRDELKTHSRHLLGAHFGHKTPQTYVSFRWFKTVLVLVLALLFSSSSPHLKLLKRVILANYN